MPAPEQSNLDYLLFAAAALLYFCGYHRWVLRGRAAVVGWTFFLVALTCGWFLMQHEGHREHLRLQELVQDFAPTYARELERMGHAKLTLETAPDDPAYLQMIEAEKLWLSCNRAIMDIYTMRKLPDGRIVMMVDSETDYDHNGRYEGEKEQRTAIGEVYTEPFESAERLLATGEPQFEDEINTDRWGTSVSAVEPLHDASGAVEGWVGLDFDAQKWLTSIRHARAMALVYTGLALLLGTAVWVAVAHHITRRDLAAEKARQAALALEKRKLEMLVNSIDGVVWECDAVDYHFTFVSAQAAALLGFPAEQWLAQPDFWRSRLHPEDWWACNYHASVIEARQPYSFDYRMLAADERTVWIRSSGAVLLDEQGEPILVRGILRDITEQRRGAEELEQTHRELMESSRKAGMADVATGVLHNVGNVLNSVNVSGNVIAQSLRSSSLTGLRRLSELLQERRATLAEFVSGDPRGQAVPDLLHHLVAATEDEQQRLGTEVSAIVKNIAHIKAIVVRQQSHARSRGVAEFLALEEIIEDALRINASSLARQGVEVEREFFPVPLVLTDKHKLLEILVNLVRNAQQAMRESPRRLLTIRLSPELNHAVRLVVRDSGCGILPENLCRIFQYGFTTKADGHGFGLHSGALSARELGGRLRVESAGLQQGAAFILELPGAAPDLAQPAPEASLEAAA